MTVLSDLKKWGLMPVCVAWVATVASIGSFIGIAMVLNSWAPIGLAVPIGMAAITGIPRLALEAPQPPKKTSQRVAQ